MEEMKGRGKLSYRCTSRTLRNGLLGLGTWYRAPFGEEVFFQTYGLWPCDNSPMQKKIPINKCPKELNLSGYNLASRRAYGFWIHSAITGESDYLLKKGVGYHGLRFRNEQYGNTAVIPMKDEMDLIRSYQILNPDGSKRFAKGCKILGLQHALRKLVNSKPIGIAESYVTAATCMELIGLSTVCAFSCGNLVHTARAIRNKYPVFIVSASTS